MVNSILLNKIKDLVERSHNNIIKAWNNPILTQDIQESTDKIIETLNQETTYIFYEGVNRQRFLNLLAGDLAITDQRRDWFLYRAIITIMSTTEMEEHLKKIYGNNYPALRSRINQIGTILEELKYHYDMMENNPRTTDKYKYHDKAVQKALTQLPLINRDLNQLLYIIATKTNLGQITVSQNTISKISQEYKKIEIPEERRTRPEPTDRPYQEGGGI